MVDFREELSVLAAETPVGRTGVLAAWAVRAPAGFAPPIRFLFAACAVVTASLVGAAINGAVGADVLTTWLLVPSTIALPSDPTLGRTHYSIGLISGGVAPNVVSPSAEAEVMFRTVSDASVVRRALEPLEARVTIEPVLEVPPVRMMTVPGFDAAVFPFTTDIPFLTRWGQPLLFGPGSIHVAHTADEFVSIADLHAAVGHYVTLARELLSR